MQHMHTITDSMGYAHLVFASAIARIHTCGEITKAGTVLVTIELLSGSSIVVDSGCHQREDEMDGVGAIDRAYHEVASWLDISVLE